MPRLTIVDFSCIKRAEIDLQPITVLIGPQASGKSIITKLFYFFSDILNVQYQNAEDGDSIRQFKARISKDFKEWFPPSAWGSKPFVLEYFAGALSISIERKKSGRRPSEEIEIKFSTFFVEQYESLFDEYRLLKRRKKSSDDDFIPTSFFENNWRVRSQSNKYLSQTLGNEYIDYQIFVPAGRSFYSNIGKAFAIFEHGTNLDKLTKRFGSLFVDLIDGTMHYYYGEKQSSHAKNFLVSQRKEIERIFGGEIKLSQNDRRLDTFDGRKIPFSALSSGQQELLPLLLVIQHFAKTFSRERESKTLNVLYLEEPEAHLFPSAQEALTAILVSLAKFTYPIGSLFITTHSPYVISKLNTLIKAADIVKKYGSSVEKRVEEIVPKYQWINSDFVSAHSIEDSSVRSIKTEDGLLDGEYLDNISGKLEESFVSLLEIEIANDSR